MPHERPLWAPWRLDYILREKSSECVFCPSEPLVERDYLIVCVRESTLVMLNKYPYNSGHLLVMPKRHTSDIESLTELESSELHSLTIICVKVLKEAFAPQGFNIGYNLGASAGAGISSHIHQHVVPRWEGDNNFMPVLSSTRVMPEHILKTYDKLKPIFDRLS